jgi:hypothetical protein
MNEINVKIVTESSFSNVVCFQYIKKDGSTQEYNVEVYDTKDDGFFGWDLSENKTKFFKFNQTRYAFKKEAFNPRFEKKGN